MSFVLVQSFSNLVKMLFHFCMRDLCKLAYWVIKRKIFEADSKNIPRFFGVLFFLSSLSNAFKSYFSLRQTNLV